MIDPTNLNQAVDILQKRIKIKRELLTFTEMEIGELMRTIEKLVIKK